MNQQNILIVDDDPQIRDVLRTALERAGYGTNTAIDGSEALRALRTGNPNLIVLDVGLPEMDGFEVCREIRRDSDIPILFLTARDDEVDRILGFEFGGDDYVTKPFSPRELVSRVKAILRRSGKGHRSYKVETLAHGALRLSPDEHDCRINGLPIALTSTEITILKKLMSRPTQVFSRPALVDAIWGPGMIVSDRTLDSHLRNLRAKLAEAGVADAIETLHGVGLRMGACRAE